jgi:hypothetical protein
MADGMEAFAAWYGESNCMMRVLVVAGAIALALLPPTVTLGAPVPGSRAVSLPNAPPHVAAGRRAAPDAFTLPIHLNAWGPLEPTQGQWYRPAGLYQPVWYQNGCFANNLFGVPAPEQSDAMALQNVTLGSLVDDRSRQLFSSTSSHSPDLPSSGGDATALGVAGLQAVVAPTACGSSRTIDL